MRNILLFSIAIIMGIVTALLIFTERINQSTIYVSDPIQLVSPIEPELIVPNHPAIKDIELANIHSALIKSLECELKVVAQTDIVINLRGHLAISKPQKFRMTISRRWGDKLEFDMGSNNREFWFWSKRMEPSVLYWATQENANNNRLKTPFNPVWMMETINGTLNIEDAKIERFNNYWKIIKHTKGADNEPILRINLLDPQKQTVIANYLINETTNKIITTHEITEWRYVEQVLVPKKIKILWHEENIALELELNNVVINQPINERLWVMPEKTPKIDIGKL